MRQLLDEIRGDWAVNDRALTRPGLHAVLVHRLGVWRRRTNRLVRLLTFPLYAPLYLIVRNLYGIELTARTKVGKRLRIAHQSGIVIHPYAEIGDDCLVRQNVTIGEASFPVKGVPKIGNRVEIGPGAVIVGKVVIGDDVKIGPNAVVTTSVPAGAVVVSPVSRILPSGAGFVKARVEEDDQPAPAGSLRSVPTGSNNR